MAEFDAKELARWCDGSWINSIPSRPVSGFCYDTRKLDTGDLFVAIETDRRDGHDFLEEAARRGASGALVHREIEGVALPQLRVSDTLAAFRMMARSYRRSWDATVIGLTGSCGKTTTKELLLQALGREPAAQGTSGNLNNLIGVPLSILSIDKSSCRFAVIEAGISEPGEMERLASVIEPDWVVFTAIGPAHLEGLGSLEGIAEEKGKLASGPTVNRVVMGESCVPFKALLFDGDAEIVAEEGAFEGALEYRLDRTGSRMRLEFLSSGGEFCIQGTGKGLASNAALAILVARELGVSNEAISERLARWSPGGMRGEWKEFGNANVYVDCYNANPLSMLDAIESFSATAEPDRPRLYVIGSMEELGEASDDWHERVGAALRLQSEDKVALIGNGAERMRAGVESAGGDVGVVVIVSEAGELESQLSGFSGNVFLKGSRRYRLEEALSFLGPPVVAEEQSC